MLVVIAGSAGIMFGGMLGMIIYGAAVGTMIVAIAGAVVGAVVSTIYDTVKGNDFGTSIEAGLNIGFYGGAIVGALIGSIIGGLAAASVSGMTNVILWSNLTGGAAAAAEIANSMSMTTIGQTFGGKSVTLLSNVFGENSQLTGNLWRYLSQTMASTLNMSSVEMYYSNVPRDWSVFVSVELPELTRRGIEVLRRLWRG